MLSQLTIPKEKTREAGLDHRQLYALGLAEVQRHASRLWTDYNVHDPGVTTLELLCYALTDLSYRATFPIKDLLATAENNAEEMKKQFFTARQILPNRPLTRRDYRKLLIDLPGIKNAWIQDHDTTVYYADLVQGVLSQTNPGLPSIREVRVSGLYDVLLEGMDGAASAEAQESLVALVQGRLSANRNLCEAFVGVSWVQSQVFILCSEVILSPDADTSRVKAEILFQVEQYLSPPVMNYTLDEMLAKKKTDGTAYTVDEIFEGPTLDCGFITDEELDAADLRTEIRLSDVISIIMDIQGVQAVREIVINPKDASQALENKWVVPIHPNQKATLDSLGSRIVFYKNTLPVTADAAKVATHLQQLTEAVRVKLETPVPYDFDIPTGVYRKPAEYDSFQNHYPAVYGISDVGPVGAVDEKRRALAYQLKGYLLFFDQLMADYLAQLDHVKELFSTNPAIERTYFHQVVTSFTDYEKIYKPPLSEFDDSEFGNQVENEEDKVIQMARRHRFLDHLIARFAEQFYALAQIVHAEFGATEKEVAGYKCAFIDAYPVISSERSLAYDASLTNPGDLWNTNNISGLEKRLAKLLGIQDSTRRNLSEPPGEGMYLIENILLRPEQEGDPFLPICPDPNCTSCAAADPYSYRIHIVLPADGNRFSNIAFRNFTETVIREETPAHILPKICWISQEAMGDFETAYRDWIDLKAGVAPEERQTKLARFIEQLFKVKNVYPSEKLSPCSGEGKKFILGQTALGTQKTEET